MENFDVIVVGSGPAGSLSAYLLAEAGLKVLIIEKKKLPRFKLCAGSISLRALNLLPKGYEKEILNVIKKAKLCYKNEFCVSYSSDNEATIIVDRTSFDYFLLSKALEKGATLLEETKVKFVEAKKVNNKIITDKGSFYSDYVIGADGYNSSVRNSFCNKKQKAFISVEVYLDKPLLRDEVIIDPGFTKKGYAWIFPKKNGVNVGLGDIRKDNILKSFEEFKSTYGINEKLNLKSWFIPYIASKKELFLGQNRVLLAGDSASLCDPLLGEGIYYALLSAKFVASSVIQNPKAPLSTYKNLVEKYILPDLIYTKRISNFVYPIKSFIIKRSDSNALNQFFRVLRGEISYKELYRWGFFELFRKVLWMS